MIGVYDVLTWLKRMPVYHSCFIMAIAASSTVSPTRRWAFIRSYREENSPAAPTERWRAMRGSVSHC